MRQYVKVPGDRIGVIIGPNGEMKKQIEELTNTVLSVDSDSGSVAINSKGEEPEDAIKVLRACDLIKAIGRGFSPEKAFILIENEDLTLDIINLSKATTSEKDMRRIKGRIIGESGKMRSFIEQTAGARVSVYGDTVSIIGTAEQINVIRSAIDMLIDGAPHGSVFSFLERKRREAKRFELDYYK